MIRLKSVNHQYHIKTKNRGMTGVIKGLFAPSLTHEVLKNINMHIRAGQKRAIVGLNGAGKSTLLKIMIGIIRPTSGEVFANGIDPYANRVSYVKGIGVVWGQRTTLWWDLTVKESIDALKRIYQIPSAVYSDRLNYFNTLLELSTYWDRPLRNLSLGQRVRVEIAASLLHKPSILFLDEPFLGLDFISRRKTLEAINHICREDTITLVLTSHHLSDIEELADSITVLRNGEIIFDGTLKELPFPDEIYQSLQVRTQESEDLFVDPNLKERFNIKILRKNSEDLYFVHFSGNQEIQQKILVDIMSKNKISEISIFDKPLEAQIRKLIHG